MSDGRARSVSLPVRPRVCARYLGELFLVAGVLGLVPLAVAAGAGELASQVPAALVAAALVTVGLGSRRIETPVDVRPNEAVVVATLAFFLVSLATSIAVACEGIAWIDAWFETVSGVTTTGLSTVGSLETRSRTFLFRRAWMQWYGGLGIVALSLALVMARGPAASRLSHAMGDDGDLVGSSKRHARDALGTYLALTGAGVALLLLLGLEPFLAITYALAAVSTGGFAPDDAGLAGVPEGAVRSAVLALAALGAISFPLFVAVRARPARTVLRDPELRALAAVLVVGGAALACTPAGPAAAGDPERLGAHGAWLFVSAQTTAGFATRPVGDLPAIAKAALIVAMAVGGSVGSTAGGIKLLRLLVLARLVHWMIVRTRLPPHAVVEPRLGGHPLAREDVEVALSVVLLFVAATLLSWAPFLVLGYDPLDALFEVVSALGTVGLSTGITGPGLEPVLKGVLGADMLLGRVEILAWLVVLAPGTWRGRR